jgi:Ca2+:H+ antiporter
VIPWCAFGVIVAADHLAEMLGEPFGTLILTFSVVAIEVMLISTVMLGGGLKHHMQEYSLPGASATG